MNPLNSIKGVWIAGIVLAVLLAAIANLAMSASIVSLDHHLQLLRWIHIVAGIIWIGLLYYFNFVQMPAVATAGSDSGGPGPAAINKYVAPRALLWFRWAALVTWLSGFVYLWLAGNLGAFALGLAGGALNAYQLLIGIGVWLGTFMLFNVWVLIWPNQKKVLGLVEATDDEKARAKKIATMASRSNVVMSIPMLMFMAAASHGLPI